MGAGSSLVGTGYSMESGTTYRLNPDSGPI